MKFNSSTALIHLFVYFTRTYLNNTHALKARQPRVKKSLTWVFKKKFSIESIYIYIYIYNLEKKLHLTNTSSQQISDYIYIYIYIYKYKMSTVR